jgi:hypothetical protein
VEGGRWKVGRQRNQGSCSFEMLVAIAVFKVGRRSGCPPAVFVAGRQAILRPFIGDQPGVVVCKAEDR